MIDDAHGFGVMGPHGRGTSEHFGVMDEIDIYIGAYAKSMAIIGGFVASDKDIIDYLKYNMRSQIYAKSLPMPIVEGCLKRLEIIDSPEGDALTFLTMFCCAGRQYQAYLRRPSLAIKAR